MRVVTEELRFPEGPIAVSDGSVLLVEIERATLSKVVPGGETSVVAELGGGPNGAAIGPDGKVYVCNNGGFTWSDANGLLRPVGTPTDYTTGSIQRVDPQTGAYDVLYEKVNGQRLKGPNDLVFDDSGGFYFTDLGKRHEDVLERGAIYYAKADGSFIEPIVQPIEQPNGIALSPDGRRLYAAETFSGKLRYWDITAPGQLAAHEDPFGVGNILYGFQSYERLDSMAVDSQGNICVATLGTGCITAISPEGRVVAMLPVPVADTMVTNICFGGEDLTTAFITSSGRGVLYQCSWHCAGQKLYYNL